MKKFFVYLTMAVAATALFASCNDKNKDGGGDDPTLAESVKGTYDVTCTVTWEPVAAPEPTADAGPATLTGKLVITGLTATTVKLETKDLKDEAGKDFLNVTAPLVKLNGTVAKVTIDDEGKLTYTENGETKEVSGATIKGDITPIQTVAAGGSEVINLTIVFEKENGTGETMEWTVVIKDKTAEPAE